MNKSLVIISILIGVLFLILAVIYFITPANALPSFLPGYDAMLTKVHYKHGIGSFFLSLGFFAYAWFKSNKKATPPTTLQ